MSKMSKFWGGDFESWFSMLKVVQSYF